jgi:hypothetical protein
LEASSSIENIIMNRIRALLFGSLCIVAMHAQAGGQINGLTLAASVIRAGDVPTAIVSGAGSCKYTLKFINKRSGEIVTFPKAGSLPATHTQPTLNGYPWPAGSFKVVAKFGPTDNVNSPMEPCAGEGSADLEVMVNAKPPISVGSRGG